MLRRTAWRNSGVAANQLLNNFPGSSLFSSINGRQSIGTGIIIARLRFEQQRAEFERRVNFMLLNVEAAYWNLYSAYVSLYSTDTALRMAYEVYNQLLHRAGPRQLKDPSMGLTHNLGGVPYLGIAAISILGLL